MSQFFAFLSRMKFINRWSLMRNSFVDNLSEHSFEVVMLSHALAIIENTLFDGNVDEGKTVAMAIYHDAPEVITGDMPTPVKYFDTELRSAYKKVENYAQRKLLSLLPEELISRFGEYLIPDESCREYALVKYADKLSAYIKTIEELSCGNNEFENASATIKRDLDANDDPLLKFFINTFIEAYRCTLDEIRLG